MENHDLVPPLQNNPTSQAYFRMPESDDRLTYLVEPDSVDRVVTPHVVLFATCLNHKLQLYVSPVPGQHAWDVYALNINWSGLMVSCIPSHGSSLQSGPNNQAVQLPCYTNRLRLARDVLVLGYSAALNEDPTPVNSIKNTTQTASQSGLSQQPSVSEPTHLMSKSGQLQEQGFFVEVAERIAVPQRPSTRTVYKSKWAPF